MKITLSPTVKLLIALQEQLTAQLEKIPFSDWLEITYSTARYDVVLNINAGKGMDALTQVSVQSTAIYTKRNAFLGAELKLNFKDGHNEQVYVAGEDDLVDVVKTITSWFQDHYDKAIAVSA